MLSSIVRLQDNQFITRQAGRRRAAQSIFTISYDHLRPHLSLPCKSSDSCRLSRCPGGGFPAKPAGSGSAWRRWSTRWSEPSDWSGRVSAIHQPSSSCAQSDTALDCPEHHREDGPQDCLDSTHSKPGPFSKAIIDPPVWKENFSRVPAPEKGIICHYCQQ